MGIVKRGLLRMSLSRQMVVSQARRQAASILSSKCSTSLTSNSLSTSSWQHIKTERRGTDDRVGVVALNRPKALNALCGPLMEELTQALGEWDKDPSIGAMVVTGNEKAFAAGANIKEMQDEDFAFLYMNRYLVFGLVFGMEYLIFGAFLY